jgi:hypothetical protein
LLKGSGVRTLLLVFLVANAGADEGALARFQRGMERYRASDYSGALEEFELAYLLQPDAALLFNEAQCHRLLGQHREAARRYREFLERADDLDRAQRQRVEEMIAKLELLAPEPEERPKPQPVAAPVERPRVELVRQIATPVKKPRPGKRWWVWTTVAATIAVGVGVGVGVGLGVERSRQPAEPHAKTSAGTFTF